ncbi:hypothetical protein AC1031_014523 [Aphanomyces cochlioides]|nr:hypothetical protein AC1031_014523 [Aphanomyces cochlioides]
MTEIAALKEQLRLAKDKLTIRRPSRSRCSYDAAGSDSRLWNMKLDIAMEQNYALEQRLAWEIEQRNHVEQCTRHQIRQLQEILEALLKQQGNPFSKTSEFVPQTPSFAPLVTTPSTGSYVSFQPNNLSPLLTEVMHVQLKFAETMQSLSQSVQTREHLLHPTPPSRQRQPIDDSDSDDDAPTLSMATYTQVLNREDTPPSFRNAPSPSHPSSPVRRTADVSTATGEEVKTPAFMSPWTEQVASEEISTTPATDESKRSVHFSDFDVMTTPTVGRAISFQDCNDDDEDESNLGAMTPLETSSITSSALNRSSFLAEFDKFRQSLAIKSPSPKKSSDAFSSKAQWSLEAQRLSTERALLKLEQSGTPTQLAELDEAIEFARSHVLKYS